MNCYYCQEPCQLIRAETGIAWAQWICRRHAHAVVFDTTNNTPTSLLCNYGTEHKGRGYVVQWYKDSTKEDWALSLATDTVNNVAQSDGVLIRTQFIPQRITPDTIDKKLPLLLPFL